MFVLCFIAYVVFLGHSLRNRAAFGADSAWPIRGYGWHDAIELMFAPVLAFTHVGLVQGAVDAKAECVDSPWPAAIVRRFALAEGLYLAGHGMHSVVNGFEDNRKTLFGISSEEALDNTSALFYFYHEVLSHSVQYLGLVAIMAVALHAESGAKSKPASKWGIALVVLHALAWVGITIGTRTVQVLAPIFIVFAMAGVLSQGALLHYFHRFAVLSLLLWALWGWRHNGSFPTFQDLQGDSLELSARVFDGLRAPLYR